MEKTNGRGEKPETRNGPLIIITITSGSRQKWRFMSNISSSSRLLSYDGDDNGTHNDNRIALFYSLKGVYEPCLESKKGKAKNLCASEKKHGPPMKGEEIHRQKSQRQFPLFNATTSKT